MPKITDKTMLTDGVGQLIGQYYDPADDEFKPLTDTLKTEVTGSMGKYTKLLNIQNLEIPATENETSEKLLFEIENESSFLITTIQLKLGVESDYVDSDLRIRQEYLIDGDWIVQPVLNKNDAISSANFNNSPLSNFNDIPFWEYDEMGDVRYLTITTPLMVSKGFRIYVQNRNTENVAFATAIGIVNGM